MKKAKILILIGVVIVALLCLVPYPLKLKDGGTTHWQPIIPVYQVYDYNALWSVEEDHYVMKGYGIYLFGIEIYENTYLVPEA